MIGNAAIAKDGSNACMEGPMAQFGRYVGDWKIEDETLAKDVAALQFGEQ
ncbi:MAG: hypothetical protein O7H40_11085 [Gammaproteobacteria bacterium]|nr:hypothetical protein [Gammaproteobacteria bacterium]